MMNLKVIAMSARDGFIVLQRFTYQNKERNGSLISYEERRRYAEKLMYYKMGVSIASIDVNRVHFYKDKNSITFKAYCSPFGESILVLLEHASQSRVLGWDEEYALLLKQSPIMKMTHEAFVAATTPCGEEVSGIGFVEPIQYSSREFKSACGKRVDGIIEGLNNFVLQLKSSLTKKELKEDVKSFYRNSKERYLKLMNVAIQAWEANCKNLLIRVDWGFHKPNAPMSAIFKTEEEISAEFAIVDSKRKQMLSRLQQMFGGDLSFYAWKIECGDKKGLHIHWLIALNGSKYKSAWFHGKEIADDWQANVCGKESYTWNACETYKKDTPYLKDLDYRDPELPKILDTFVGYLTKLDVTMKLIAPKGFRSFGCSKLKSEKVNKPGPVRTGVNTLKVGVK